MKKIYFTLIAVLMLLTEVHAQTIDTLPCGQRERDFYYTEWYDTATYYLNPDDSLVLMGSPNSVHFIWYGNDNTPTGRPYVVFQQYTEDTLRIKGLWAMVSQTSSGDPYLHYSKLPEHLYLYIPNPKVNTDTLSSWDTASFLTRITTTRWDTAQPKMLCLTKTEDGRFGSQNYGYCHLYRAMFDTIVTLQGEFWIGGSCISNILRSDHLTYEYFPTRYLTWGMTDRYGMRYPHRVVTSGYSPDGPWYWLFNTYDHRRVGHGPFGAIVDMQHFVGVTSADTAQGRGLYSAYYPDSSYQTITAVAKHGFRFTHWNDSVTDNPRTILVTQDTAFTAYFEGLPMYQVSTTSNNDSLGHVTGDSTYYEGDNATLRAIPNISNARFVGWGDSITDNPRTILVTQDTLFTAHFALDTLLSIDSPDQTDILRFTLTPNPASTSVTIAIDDPQNLSRNTILTFADASGRRLLTIPVTESKLVIPLKKYSSGTYFVTISSPQGSHTKKLVIR